MKNKWSIVFWVMLIAGVASFSRTNGSLLESAIVVLALGGIAFLITHVVDIVTGWRSPPQQQLPEQNAARPSAASMQTAAPEAIAPGSPRAAPSGPPAPPGAITAEPLPMPPILLEPTSAQRPAPQIIKKETESKDPVRELIETVVFVVVLVLMLKTFQAEAFVIPTGSMANTLLGYHYNVACPDCGKPNQANASDEAEPQDGRKALVISSQCQNCGYTIEIRKLPPPPQNREGQP